MSGGKERKRNEATMKEYLRKIEKKKGEKERVR